MEFDIVTRFILGLASIVGTMAVVFLNARQAAKVKAELLEKFEEAIAKEKKHSATELFRLIHGIRMSYTDIVELIKEDECSKIIFALKKTPRLVSYKNSRFQYTSIGGNKILKVVNAILNKFGVYLFGGVCIFATSMLMFGDVATALAGLIVLPFSAAMLSLLIYQNGYDNMVENLVNGKEHNN